VLHLGGREGRGADNYGGLESRIYFDRTAAKSTSYPSGKTINLNSGYNSNNQGTAGGAKERTRIDRAGSEGSWK